MILPTTPIFGLRYQALTDAPNGATLGQNLAEDVEAALQAGSGGVNGEAVTSGSDTTVSASYVNMAGTGAVTSFSITKRHSSTITQLRVQMHVGIWVATAVGTVRCGVLINAVDSDVCQLSIPVVSEHYQTSGVRYITGLAAGVYTVQGRWKRTAGTGTLTRDVNDWLSISAEEVSV